MYAVRFTSTAEADLQEIMDYVSRVLDNPSAAESLLDQIDKRTRELSDYPEAHPLVPRQEKFPQRGCGRFLGLFSCGQAETLTTLNRYRSARLNIIPSAE